jgi:hypothetical protein
MATPVPAPKGKPKYLKTRVGIGNQKIDVYATPKLGHALEEMTEDMTLYEGVKFEQILKAMYEQGKKDGAREAFNQIEEGFKAAQKAVPHRNPGKPKGK